MAQCGDRRGGSRGGRGRRRDRDRDGEVRDRSPVILGIIIIISDFASFQIRV